MSFASRGVDPADGFARDGFRVRPLTPSDTELDYEAVMSSREFLYHWEQDPPWPAEDFTLEEDRAGVDKMWAEHQAGTRYTYTVMNADETKVLGCVCFIPPDDRMYRFDQPDGDPVPKATVSTIDGSDLSTVDATISFWVRPSTWSDGLERDLLRGLVEWLRDDWALSIPVFVTNEALTHQIATIESLGLTRRFVFDRDKDMYTSFVYA